MRTVSDSPATRSDVVNLFVSELRASEDQENAIVRRLCDAFAGEFPTNEAEFRNLLATYRNRIQITEFRRNVLRTIQG